MNNTNGSAPMSLFARLLHEARYGPADNPSRITFKKKDKEPQKEATIEPDRMVRKPQVIKQTVTYGLIKDEEYELNQRQQGIHGARKRFSTSVSYCKKKHVRLVCRWSGSDVANRGGTWRLENIDYRKDTSYFDNGVEDHQNCSSTNHSDLLAKLAKRMIEDFEDHEHMMYSKKSYAQKARDYRDGAAKRKSPQLNQVVRALGELAIYVVGHADETGKTGDKDKLHAGENADNGSKDSAKPNKPTKQEVKLAQLRKKMEERAHAKSANKEKVEALSSTSKSSVGGRSFTKDKVEAPEHRDNANVLQIKKEKATVEPVKSERKEPKPKTAKSEPDGPKASKPATKTPKPVIKNEANNAQKKAPPKEGSSKPKEKKTKERKKIAKTKNGKPYKSKEFVEDSDLEDDATKATTLKTDKLEGEKVSVESIKVEKTSSSTDQDGKGAEVVVETATVAIKVESRGTTERTEVTEITGVSSTSSKDGEVVVEHATHARDITAVEVSSQEPPRDPAVLSHSSKKRKHEDSVGEVQRGWDRPETPSSPKKCKIAPTPSSGSEKATVPSRPSILSSLLENETIAEATSSSSLGAVSVASSRSSSSSKKRKMFWSEEAGEVTIGPGGTKRAKRVQFSTEVPEGKSEDIIKVPGVVKDTKVSVGFEEASQFGDLTIEAYTLEGEGSQSEDDSKSLFDSSPTSSKKGEDI